jgi:hypothetical protein
MVGILENKISEVIADNDILKSENFKLEQLMKDYQSSNLELSATVDELSD